MAHSKRIAFLVKKFSADKENFWLTDELINEFSNIGYRVDVYLLDTKDRWGNTKKIINQNVTLRSYRFRLQANVLFKIFDLFAANKKIKEDISIHEYSYVFNFSIASLFWGVVKKVKTERKKTKSVLILWDFFPTHQVQIGKLVPYRFITKFLYWLENREVVSSDYVALMSSKNIDYFRRYHSNYKGKTFKLLLWGRRYDSELQQTENDHSKSVNFVFGGQLSRGRGIEQLCDFANENRDLEATASINIIGAGELKEYIQARIKSQKLSNIKLYDPMPRKQYRQFISKMDVGLIFTVPNVDVPTFPSKVIDYMSVGLPVLSCVERESDFGDFIQYEAGCGLKVEAENLSGIREAVEQFVKLKKHNKLKDLGQKGKEYFYQYMTVESAAETIVNETKA